MTSYLNIPKTKEQNNKDSDYLEDIHFRLKYLLKNKKEDARTILQKRLTERGIIASLYVLFLFALSLTFVQLLLYFCKQITFKNITETSALMIIYLILVLIMRKQRNNKDNIIKETKKTLKEILKNQEK